MIAQREGRWQSTSTRVLALGAVLLLAVAATGARPAPQPASAARPNPKATIAVIRAADWIGTEWTLDALKFGLSEAGLDLGVDYEFKESSAQGDLATLPSLIDAALDAKVDVIVTLQDATLQVAAKRVRQIPIVFNILADPFAAGAGASDSVHRANITGVYSPGFGDPEQQKRVELIKRLVPSAKRVGVLYSPGEQLSVNLKDRLTSAGKAGGLEVVAVPVNSPSDATTATNTLVDRRVDAIEIFGNDAHAGFESVIKVAKAKNIPVFSPSPFEIMKGAMAALYPDFQEGGVIAGNMIARILKGESPGSIPFYRLVTSKTQVQGQ
jgi:putative ABC transport system substrate-binding protein